MRLLRFATLRLGPFVLAAVAPGPGSAQATAGATTGAEPAQQHREGERSRATPMRPRIGDPRISYIRVNDVILFGNDTLTGRYIVRFRLVKEDPTAAVSDVVRPIVYYINTNIPEQWRPWVERGVKAWLPVLESVGFRNAMVVRTEPDRGSDAANDTAVHIRFDPEETDGATHPNIDPATGEVLGASIDISPTVALQYCLQGAAFGTWPDLQRRHACPDSIVGRVLQMIITHEVGHSLGLNHNFKGASVYPTDSLRSPSFVHRWGYTASVMSYAFVDYIAQPEDHIPLDDLIQHIGPYDKWALDIAYRPIPGAKTPEDELPTLERWRAAQDTAPYLRATVARFSSADPGDKPGVTSNDALKAAIYQLHNLERYASHLTAPPDTLEQTALTNGWAWTLSYAMNMVAGEIPRAPYPEALEKTVIGFVDSTRQLQAFEFLLAHALYGRDAVARAVIGRRPAGDTLTPVLFDSVAPGWDPALWKRDQVKLFAGLLQESRLAALEANTHILPLVCAELRTLDQALEKVLSSASTPAAHAQAQELREKLEPALGANGHCRSASTKTPRP